jgi:hypothetical protein
MNKIIEKYIKTECGINKFHRLKELSKKNIFNRIRFFWFVGVSAIRDIFK